LGHLGGGGDGFDGDEDITQTIGDSSDDCEELFFTSQPPPSDEEDADE
jgi:hypothetical protein